MKIISWNIHHGGNKNLINKIINSIFDKNAEINILIEYRENNNGKLIKNYFKNKGFYIYTSKPNNNDNGILILSKFELRINSDFEIIGIRQRYINFKFLNYNFLAVHIPGGGDKYSKKDFWDRIIDFTKKNNKNTIIIGDFNTGFTNDTQGAKFKLGNYMYLLENQGFVDIFKKFNINNEYSWYSYKGNGFRIDHSFCSIDCLKQIRNCYFSHYEREQKISDHSILILELNN